MPKQLINTALLRRQIIDHFDISEFRTLCFDLRINYDVLGGDGLADKARELVAYCERNGCLDDLVNICNTLRPKTNWRTDVKQKFSQKQGVSISSWIIEAYQIIAESQFSNANLDETCSACDLGEIWCKGSAFDEEKASFLYWKSRVASITNNYVEAHKSIKLALDLLGNKPRNRFLQGYLYAQLGSLYGYLSSEELYSAQEMALEVAEEFDLPPVKVRALLQKGWIKLSNQFSTDSYQLGRTALDIAKDYDLAAGQVASHRLLVYSCLRLNRGEEAVLHSEETVQLSTKYGLPADLHLALYDKSCAWRFAHDDWQTSLELTKKSLQIANKYKFEPNRKIIGGWFDIAFALGNWHEAKQILENYYQKLPPSFDRSWGFYFRRLGHLGFARGRFEEALGYYEQAHNILLEKSSETSDAKRLEPYLGLAKIENGDLEDGKKHLENAYSYWETRSIPRAVRSLRGLAKVELINKNYIQAVSLLHKANKLAIKIKSNESTTWPIRPQVSIDLGMALFALGSTDRALEMIFDGYQSYKKWGHFLFGEAAFALGKSYVYLNQSEQALVYFNEAFLDWKRLELDQHFKELKTFLEEHNFSLEISI